METPEVRYARAADGTPLAFRVLGKGPTTLWFVLSASFEDEWRIPEAREFFQHLASRRALIPVDPRATGMSGGSTVADSRVHARDLLAVADHVGATEFSLVTAYQPEIALAVHDEAPGRLLRTAVFLPIADFELHSATTVSPGFQQFGRLDRYAYGRLQADYSGLEDPESRRLFAEAVAARWSHDDYAAFADAGPARSALVRALAPAFEPPLLAIHRKDALITVEQSRLLAANVQNGRVHNLDGRGLAPYGGDWRALAETIERFLDEESAEKEGTAATAGPFQTILFTDLESSTALTQRLGDEAAQEVLRGHNAAVRTSLEAHGGREVKHTGDGIMAAFPSAVRAVEAALQVQKELAGGEVRVRIGLNAGEPISEDDDLFGTAVQLAARICDRAEPGQVLVSRVVADLCAGKRLQFSHHSDATLKGFAEPVALYEVGS